MQEAPKIGVFGGTFDPPHIAHLIIAQEAALAYGLRSIVFVPALVPPHKPTVTISPFEIRLRMVDAAVAGDPRFEVSDIEGRLPSPSFTVDTLEVLRQERGNWGDMFLIIGSDSLLDLPSWKTPERLFQRAQLIVYPRQGFPPGNVNHAILEQVTILPVPEIPISSTMLRQRVAMNQSIRYWVPERVREIVETEGLYSQTS